MHDCKGRPLSVGDRVMVPFTVTQAMLTEEYCNLSLETVATMHPGTSKTSMTANARQVLRANDGDDIAYQVVRDGEVTRIE